MTKYIAILILALTAHVALAGVIEIEAEDAKVDPANVVELKEASGGKYICFEKETKAISAVFEFELPADGKYQFWGVAHGPSGNQDSFFFQFDSEKKREIWDLAGSKTLVAQPVRQRVELPDNKMSGKPLIVELTKGKHTLTISRREPGAQLDKIMIAEESVDMKKLTSAK